MTELYSLVWYILHTERRNVQHLLPSDHINMMRYFWNGL